jgi:hypothetical protein
MKSKNPLSNSEIQCVTVDQEDIDNIERTCHVSHLEDPKDNIHCLGMLNRDALKEYFLLSVLAFLMKHQKRTLLFTVIISYIVMCFRLTKNNYLRKWLINKYHFSIGTNGLRKGWSRFTMKRKNRSKHRRNSHL